MEVLMSETRKLTNKYRLEQWNAIIQERINSGKCVDVWCKENNITRDSYYYWLRKVKHSVIKKKPAKPSPQLPKVVHYYHLSWYQKPAAPVQQLF
jgi:hypothetical protein